MKKLKLRFPEEFTVHAVALLNHIHSQPRRTKVRSLESRLQQLNSAGAPLTPRGGTTEADVKLATSLK